MSSPQVGDVLATAEQLDACPTGAYRYVQDTAKTVVGPPLEAGD